MSDNIFENVHKSLLQQIDPKLGLNTRDIAYFRGHHFHNKHTRGDIEKALRKRLPHLKAGKSYRYNVYLRRLDFIYQASEKDWQTVIQDAKIEDYETVRPR